MTFSAKNKQEQVRRQARRRKGEKKYDASVDDKRQHKVKHETEGLIKIRQMTMLLREGKEGHAARRLEHRNIGT